MERDRERPTEGHLIRSSVGLGTRGDRRYRIQFRRQLISITRVTVIIYYPVEDQINDGEKSWKWKLVEETKKRVDAIVAKRSGYGDVIFYFFVSFYFHFHFSFYLILFNLLFLIFVLFIIALV